MADKHADLKCSLTIATRGGGVLTVPGITVEKAEAYADTLVQCNAHPELRNSPINLYGNDGLSRLRFYPSELAGTSITAWGEVGVNPWATNDPGEDRSPAGFEDVELPLGDIDADVDRV